MLANNLKSRCACAVAVIATLAMPLTALADEKDELSLSEPALAAQRKLFSIIGLVIGAAVVAYIVRWWQATHSGNVVDGGASSDD
jgi:hypothetical protein